MLNKVACIALVLCVGVALAGPKGGRGGPQGGHGRPGGPEGPGRHGPTPPFLQNATAEARKEFFDIMKNESLTITEQKAEVQTWAAKYQLTTEVNDFEQEIETKKAEAQKNATDIIAVLPEKLTELTTILNNENQTRQQQEEALQAFREENPQVARVLQALVFPPRDHPAGPKPEGKNGGKGGDKKGKKGGRH